MRMAKISRIGAQQKGSKPQADSKKEEEEGLLSSSGLSAILSLLRLGKVA